MNFSKLKILTQALPAVFGFSLLVASCNNSDESANNSTSAANESSTDTTIMAKTDNTVVAPSASTTMKRKPGKISTTIVSDDPSVKITMDKSGYYNRTDVAPAYSGGQSALDDYITKNIEYPQDAIDNNVEGVVNVQFAVDEKGKVSNVKAVGPKLGYGLEEEATKVVANMPDWTPGKVKGKNVKTWRTLPINYRLEG